MRWRIWGSDVSDGNSVLLDVEADTAVDAVAQAHDRKVIVGRVMRSGGRRLLRAAPYLLLLATIGLSISTGVLHTQLSQARQGAADSGQDSQRLIADLESSQDEARGMRERAKFLEGSLTEREKQREIQMKELAAKIAGMEESLRAAQGNAATSAAAMEKMGKESAAKSAALTKQIEGLKRDLAIAGEKYAELDRVAAADRAKRDEASRETSKIAARASEAEARVAALDLKLAQQAKASEETIASLKAQVPQGKNETDALPRPALGVGYDAVLDFTTLAVGKPKMEPQSVGVVRVTSMSEIHASGFVMHTDKQRVFDGALTVCLADDTPKEVLAENRAALTKFVGLFAPKWKGWETWTEAAFKACAGKAENERIVLMSAYYRVSVWGNKIGQLTVKIEPAGEER